MKLFKSLALILSLSAAPVAQALDWVNTIGAGIHLDSYQSDLPDRYDNDQDWSLAATAGWKTMIFWGNIGLRSGAFFEFKRAEVDDRGVSPQQEMEATAYYVAIPLNLQLNLNDHLAIFGGVTPRILLARTCERCGDFDDAEILVNYANAGVTWKFNDRWSTDVSFHHAIGDNFDDFKISTTQVLLNYQL